jgi:hypothetical protein
MPHQHLTLTRAYAVLIRQWHERYGSARPPSHMNEDEYFRYRERVHHFHGFDLSILAHNLRSLASSSRRVSSGPMSKRFPRNCGMQWLADMRFSITAHQSSSERQPGGFSNTSSSPFAPWSRTKTTGLG